MCFEVFPHPITDFYIINVCTSLGKILQHSDSSVQKGLKIFTISGMKYSQIASLLNV